MGWWFGRILTFEVIADVEPPTIGGLLADASGGAIRCSSDQQLIGFAAYGRSIRNAVEPLVDSFGIDLLDDGAELRAPNNSLVVTIGEDELGNSEDKEPAPRLLREQLPVRAAPIALRLSYYDPARDYQTGEARAVAGEQGGSEAQQELPAVLNAGDAKSLAQEMLARAWSRREKLTLRLPPKELALEPGSQLTLPLYPPQWTVDAAKIEGFVLVAELRPSAKSGVAIVADSGRIVPNSDIGAGPLGLALLDVPNVLGLSSTEPAVLLAATTATEGWKRRPVEVSFGGQSIACQTARSKSVLGHALSAIAAGGPELIDDENSIEVELIDGEQWLTSCDDDGLAAGKNLAALGSELIQFGRAEPLGGGRFQLSHLLRGRGGTEWACSGHAADEVFCVIQSASLQPVALPTWSIGAVVTASAAGSPNASIQLMAEDLRPPEPVKLAAETQANGDLLLSWIRRSRQGFAWVDGVDAPLGETREFYRVVMTGSLSSVEFTVEQPTVTLAAVDVAALGGGSAVIEVRQIGDQAASRPAQLSIILS